MENLLYWKGKAIGTDCGSYVGFFPSASAEDIADYKKQYG